MGADGDIAGLELPLLVGVVESGDEAPLLLGLGDVEEELDDRRAVASGVPLAVGDGSREPVLAQVSQASGRVTLDEHWEVQAHTR